MRIIALQDNKDVLVKNRKKNFIVIPVETGIQSFQVVTASWIPAPRSESRTSFAGMTTFYECINKLNKRGMTLVEVMISLVVLLLVFLALMQTALVSIDSNMKNLLRDEAVSIAEERMVEARNLIFTEAVCNLVSDPNPLPVGADCPAVFPGAGDGVRIERDFRNIAGFDFCTYREVVEIGGDGALGTCDAADREVTITVGWVWKGGDYIHTIPSIVRRL